MIARLAGSESARSAGETLTGGGEHKHGCDVHEVEKLAVFDVFARWLGPATAGSGESGLSALQRALARDLNYA